LCKKGVSAEDDVPIPEKLLLQDKEIADVVGIPLGTVMFGLARARKWLRQSLMKTLAREP
jgi:hypothetical protein